jgi:imidazolonepropionase-like amidohydrolase
MRKPQISLCRGFLLLFCFAVALAGKSGAQGIEALAPEVRKYVSVSAARVVLEHVGIIDGTGAAPRADQNITIEGGKITAISAGTDVQQSDGTTVLNLHGHSVIPGIVGMHGHVYYFAFPNMTADYSFEGPAVTKEMVFSAPRLYLANGVTTMRTAGTYDPYAEVELRAAIENGTVPGPHLDVTGRYLQGGGSSELPNGFLTGPDDARQTVAFWADHGVTSFKPYNKITRAELRAAIEEAHKRGLKVTGHLCSVTYDEAIDAGIDNLEHGFSCNIADDPDKKPDTCSSGHGEYTLEHMTADSPAAHRLINNMIAHHVAVTSTLPNSSAVVAREAGQDPSPAAALEAMSPAARQAYSYWRARPKPPQSKAALLLRREMDLERTFVAAGGLLLAGSDPGGPAGGVPGFADHREIKLLVEAGFTPLQAIHIATLNGATFLGSEKHVGSVETGKNADLLVVKGDPATRITDIDNVEYVFKEGVGSDPKKLLDSVKGRYGEY